MTRLLALLVILVATSGVAASAALAVADFRTPGYAAYCGVSEGEPPVALICWTPNDGFTVSMREHRSAAKRYDAKNLGSRDFVGRVLLFGQQWHPSGIGFWCTSRRTGLTCWNRAGHGWWLGRFRGYRLF